MKLIDFGKSIQLILDDSFHNIIWKLGFFLLTLLVIKNAEEQSFSTTGPQDDFLLCIFIIDRI